MLHSSEIFCALRLSAGFKNALGGYSLGGRRRMSWIISTALARTRGSSEPVKNIYLMCDSTTDYSHRTTLEPDFLTKTLGL